MVVNGMPAYEINHILIVEKDEALTRRAMQRLGVLMPNTKVDSSDSNTIDVVKWLSDHPGGMVIEGHGVHLLSDSMLTTTRVQFEKFDIQLREISTKLTSMYDRIATEGQIIQRLDRLIGHPLNGKLGRGEVTLCRMIDLHDMLGRWALRIAMWSAAAIGLGLIGIAVARLFGGTP